MIGGTEMTKIIQQVHFSTGMDFYITDFDLETNILTYRKPTTANAIKEEVNIIGDRVECFDFWFNLMYLHKFLIENEMIPIREVK
jgi:hypothetical protein